MHRGYFGDTYDLAKRALMHILAADEPWGIVPMFTDEWTMDAIHGFERLLQASVLSADVIGPDDDRSAYFQGIKCEGHTLADPDTGVSIEHRRPDEWPKFIADSELADLVLRNPKYLTLVYDQSYSRQTNLATPRMLRKLAKLNERTVEGFGYLGQASFLILSCDLRVIEQARERLLDTGVPSNRLVSLP